MWLNFACRVVLDYEMKNSLDVNILVFVKPAFLIRVGFLVGITKSFDLKNPSSLMVPTGNWLFAYN